MKKTLKTLPLSNGIIIELCRFETDSQLHIRVVSAEGVVIGTYGIDDMDRILLAVAAKYSNWTQEQIAEIVDDTKRKVLPNGIIVEIYRGVNPTMSSSYFVRVLAPDLEDLNGSCNTYKEAAEKIFRRFVKRYSRWSQKTIDRELAKLRKRSSLDWQI